MPKQYEAIRDKFKAEGMSEDEAQSRAAAIYNSRHPNRPMSGQHPEGAPRRSPRVDMMRRSRQ